CLCGVVVEFDQEEHEIRRRHLVGWSGSIKTCSRFAKNRVRQRQVRVMSASHLTAPEWKAAEPNSNGNSSNSIGIVKLRAFSGADLRAISALPQLELEMTDQCKWLGLERLTGRRSSCGCP